MIRNIAIGAAIMALASPAIATTAFDFQSTAAKFYPGSLTVNDGPVSLTVTVEGKPNGYVDLDYSGIASLGYGVTGANGSVAILDQFSPLRFSFNTKMDSVTFNFGDHGGDDDGFAMIKAYTDQNVLLGTVSVIFPAGFSAAKSLTPTFQGASYYIASSGAGLYNANSLRWDISDYKVAVHAVPEPASWALMIAGFATIGSTLRRRHEVAVSFG